MQYPSDWTATTTGLTEYTEVVAFYSPFNASEVSPVRVIMSVIIYSQNASLPEYTDLLLTRANQSEPFGLNQSQSAEIGINQSEISSLKVDLKSHSEVTLAGHPGHNMFLTISQPMQNTTLTMHQMNTWTAIGNKVYSLMYQGEEPSFSRHMPEVNRMLESLVIE